MEACKVEEFWGACFEKTDYQVIFTFMPLAQENLPQTSGQKTMISTPKMAHTLLAN